MERRPLLIGLAVAAAATVLLRLLNHSLLPLLEPLLAGSLHNLLGAALGSLPWLLGGAATGYCSLRTPLRNGALVGALGAFLFSLIGMAQLASQTHDLDARLMQLGHGLAAMLRYAFLFALAAALGAYWRMSRQG